jgi:hypothetical protein
MIYSNEQWDIIKKASPHYETARHEYIRNAPRQLTEQVMNVYEAATGKKIYSKDLSCAVCVLHIYQQIGKTYFADLEEKNKLESKDNDTRSETKKGNAKPKTGNKKKKE